MNKMIYIGYMILTILLCSCSTDTIAEQPTETTVTTVHSTADMTDDADNTSDKIIIPDGTLITLTLDNQNADAPGTSQIYLRYNQGYYLDSEGQFKMNVRAGAIQLPSKDGSRFIGYYDATNDGKRFITYRGLLDADVTFIDMTDDTVLYAKWNILPVDLSDDVSNDVSNDASNDVSNRPATPLIQYSADGKELVHYSQYNDATSYTVPDGVEKINGFCTNCPLKSITLPSSIMSIYFGGCDDLEEIKMNNESGGYYKCIDGVLFSWDGKTLVKYPPKKAGDTYRVPDGVTKITAQAFSNCTGLKSVELPDSLQDIGSTGFNEPGSGAFFRCTGLTSITIPDNVTTMGKGAFYECTGLTNISVGKGVKTLYLYYCSELTSLTIPNGVETLALHGCSSLKNVNIPDSVTSIDFEGCSSLESVVIPDGVTVFAGYTFWGCTSLKSIVIPNTVKKIWGYAFFECKSLENIVIPEGVEEIDDGAFYRCSSLKSVVLPDSLTENIFGVFGGNISLTDLTVPYLETPTPDFLNYSNGTFTRMFGEGSSEGVKYCSVNSTQGGYVPLSLRNVTAKRGQIVQWAFKNCDMIESLTLGVGITDIQGGAFDGCNIKTVWYEGTWDQWAAIYRGSEPQEGYLYYSCNLLDNADTLYINGEQITGDVVVPDGVTKIAACSFMNYKGITSIVIPDSVTEIEFMAFEGCTNLKSVTIGNGVTRIGKAAFSGCSALENVTMGSSVAEIGDEAFYNCSSLKSFPLPESLVNIGDKAFKGCNTMTGKLTIPDNVKTIGKSAFENCTMLMTLEFGDSLESIGDDAFNGCIGVVMYSLDIPDSTTYVGLRAFNNISTAFITAVNIGSAESIDGFEKFLYEAANLRYITASASNKAYRSEEDVLYSKDNKVVVRYAPQKVSDDYMMPDVVEVIHENAFANCSGLTSHLVIPSTVREIGNGAFKSCSRVQFGDVIVPNGVPLIGANTFSGCSGLTSIDIPDSVTEIGEYAFSGCDELTTVVIGDGVISIGACAFYNSRKINNVTIGSSIRYLGFRCFFDSQGQVSIGTLTIKSVTPPSWGGGITFSHIYVPEESVDAYKESDDWMRWKDNIAAITE